LKSPMSGTRICVSSPIVFASPEFSRGRHRPRMRTIQ
jgi:hypothetical protein